MLYVTNQIRQIEQAALTSLAPGKLMQAAGKAAAEKALTLLHKPNASLLVFAGPGNNGGDALVAAVHLAKAGHNVFILHHPPTSPMSSDCQRAFDEAKACPQLTWLESDTSLDSSFALVIDGLFGIGLKPKALSSVLKRQIDEINTLHNLRPHTFPILALDVPSGLDADTGNLVTSIAIQASHTITFIGDKPGLHTGYGRDYAGSVEVANLDIPPELFPVTDIELNDVKLFADQFQPRPHNSNKASFGSVMIMGGATGMQGAVILSGRAALYSGAGKVFVGFHDAPPAYDPLQPELMCRLAENLPIQDATVVVIGPGLGQSDASVNLVQKALVSAPVLVIDADALNIIAQHGDLLKLCRQRKALTTLLTPHPLEAARLLQCTTEEVQADRIAAARKLAQKYAALVILKGSGSIIANPLGQIVINPTGNPGLATGGTGDVLAGVCGSLIAQHPNIWKSALAATYLHGAAADNLVNDGAGPVGLYAGELCVEIRKLLNSNLYSLNSSQHTSVQP